MKNPGTNHTRWPQILLILFSLPHIETPLTMASALDHSPNRGADSHSDSSSHIAQDIWSNTGFSADGNNGSGGGGGNDRTNSHPTSSQGSPDHLDFSDIFSDIKSDYQKVIALIENSLGFGIAGSTDSGSGAVATTGIEKGSTIPSDNAGNMSASKDAAGHTTDLQYADGSTRHFDYNGNDLSDFVDRSGKKYTRDASGQWDGPDGKPANISNVNVMPDGTFSYKETQTGNVIVCSLDGSYKTVTADQLGDLSLYPDSQNRAAENKSLEQKAAQPDFLNPDGQRLLTQLNQLGVDDVDALYGSHIVFGGDGKNPADGGALYRNLIQNYPVKERTSSHYPGTTTKQYQIITGPGNSAVLFGLTPDGNTFIQFEKDVAGTSSHNNDYNLYRTLDQNVGPLGVSPHTDQNPVELGYQQ